MRNIIINSSNIVPDTNNSRFVYRFPTTQKFERMQIALGNFNFNQSIFNVSVALNNNKFQYIWYDNAGASPLIDVVMPDGIYTIQDINAFLQFTMIQNGHYLINDVGEYVYYLSLTVNRVRYGYEISSDPIPTALPMGWSNPAGLTFPAVATTPQLVIPTPQTNIVDLLGFPVGSYPPVVQATTYNQITADLSPPTVPQISPVSSVLIACSLVENSLQYPNQVFYSFVNSTTIPGGYPVSIVPPRFSFINIADGYSHSLVIQLLDQNFQPIGLYDPDVMMQILFCQECTPIMKGLKQ